MKNLKDVKSEIDKLRQNLLKILYVSGESTNLDFYISALTEYNPFHSTEEISQWLSDINKEEYFSVEQIPLADLRQWHFDQWSGNLCHDSGKFFSIRGLKVRTNVGSVSEWDQPIIDQPEIGVLGIIAKKIDGILYFLMQAKAEPGNINTFQLSPTVQATRSNYLQVHGGKPTKYLEYFLDQHRSQVLIDQLQSEQGARFFHKRNRNIIVQVRDDEEIEITPNHRWVTLGQLKKLMLSDNTINMDARSVISNIVFDPEEKNSLDIVNEQHLQECLESCPIVSDTTADFGIKMMISAHSNTPSLHSYDALLRRISRGKFSSELNSQLIPLNEVKNWSRTPLAIHHEENRFFSVIGVRVSAANREVPSWDQPIVQQVDKGLVGYIVSEINGVMHFLVQLKMESGNMDLLELSPTVQCITGSYGDSIGKPSQTEPNSKFKSDKMPLYVNEMLDPTNSSLIFDTLQSEEGGRFYREENRNMVLLKDLPFPVIEQDFYFWMTLHQLKMFLKFNNFLNVESRSLLAII